MPWLLRLLPGSLSRGTCWQALSPPPVWAAQGLAGLPFNVAAGPPHCAPRLLARVPSASKRSLHFPYLLCVISSLVSSLCWNVSPRKNPDRFVTQVPRTVPSSKDVPSNTGWTSEQSSSLSPPATAPCFLEPEPPVLWRSSGEEFLTQGTSCYFCRVCLDTPAWEHLPEFRSTPAPRWWH